jgi:hypothetical protein
MTGNLSLSSGLASAHQAELRRAADLARRASNGSRRDSLFRRAIARLHADAGKSASPRRTYELAPTVR